MVFAPAAASLMQRALVLFYCAVAFLMGVVRTSTISLVGAMPIGELLLLVVLAHAVLWIALTGRLPAPLPAPRMLLRFVLC
jgi:hypothetical protein